VLSVIASCAVAPMGIVILIRVMAIALDKFIYILGIGCLFDEVAEDVARQFPGNGTGGGTGGILHHTTRG